MKMKILKIIFPTSSMRLLLIPVLLTILGVVPLAHARVSQVSVAVDGMSCPFCAFGVEKKLKKVDGVDSVAVDLKSGKATLTATEGRTIQVNQVHRAVKSSGFTPGKILVTAVGTLSADGQQSPLFKVDGTRQIFRLINLKDSTKNRVKTLAKTGMLVKISGILKQHADEVPAITLESIDEVSK
jgi:mercuric ion binding protein